MHVIHYIQHVKHYNLFLKRLSFIMCVSEFKKEEVALCLHLLEGSFY